MRPLSICVLVLVVGNSASLAQNSVSKYLGTSGATEREFNRYALEGRPPLPSDFILVGIEKADRNKTGVFRMDQFNLNQLDRAAKKRLLKVYDGSKWMFVSHICYGTPNGTADYYNVYANRNIQNRSPFEDGVTALKSLAETITGRIRDEGFTDIFVLCRGFLNPQERALRVSQEFANGVKAKLGPDRRPLFVVLTWPSKWTGEMGSKLIRGAVSASSFMNKKNDADEVGGILGNLLINHVLPRAVGDRPDVKIVVTGHSLGGRLVARAVHGRSFLADAPARQVDLVVCMQPAFSLNRFINGSGLEGAPFNFQVKPNLVLTCSNQDRTMNKMRLANYGGNLKVCREYGSRYPGLFSFSQGSSGLSAQFGTSRVNLVDLSGLVQSHGDVNDQEMAAFVIACLEAS